MHTLPHLCPESCSSPALSRHCLLEEIEGDGRLTSGGSPSLDHSHPLLLTAVSDRDRALIILLTSISSPDISGTLEQT